MDKTDNKLIITPKDDKYVTMTIRTEKKIQEEFNKLSALTNRSRNELINRALKFALDNMVVDDEEQSRIILFTQRGHSFIEVTLEGFVY